MRKTFLILFALLSFFGYSQSAITYELAFDNIAHHELHVKVTFSDLKTNRLEIRMPNASPGRYAAHNFAKNVYEEKATDLSGKKVALSKLTPFTWEAEVVNGGVIFEYTIYGNHADGTYLGVDARKVHMNMPATFVYGTELEDRTISLIIPSYKNWEVATQLQKKGNNAYEAPNYYYFYDSPTLVGAIDWRRWEYEGQQLEIAMMHEGTEAELDQYTEWVKKIVKEQASIYGGLPKYDYGRYTFIISYNPWVHGDAMEHRNSTVCTSTYSLAEHAERLVRTVSHEFFHGWNIERIRPASLEPFDFDQPNLSEALWFGEGFTNYFDRLVTARAGIHTPEYFINGQVGSLNAVLNSAGRRFRSPIQMSHHAAFTDAGTSNDATNYANTFVSYYTYGSVIALGLDLTLRTEFNTNLDAYMKAVWEQYGKTETPYTMADLEQVLAKLTKAEFARSFFQNQIYGSELPDFEVLLEQFGIKLSIASPESAYFGNPKLNNRGVVTSTILRGTALYEAGIEQGDRLLSIDDRELDTTGDLNRIINSLQVGKTYPVVYEQLGERKESSFTTTQDPRITLSYIDDSKLKSRQVKQRKQWLGID